MSFYAASVDDWSMETRMHGWRYAAHDDPFWLPKLALEWRSGVGYVER